MKSSLHALPSRSPRNRATNPSLFLSAKVARSLSVSLAAAFAAAATMQAASVTYDGGPGGTGTNWGDAVNWSADAVPANTDSLFFNVPNTTITINLGASREAKDITFNNASTAYTIGSASDVSSGYSLTVGNVKRDTTAGGIQTIAANVVMSSPIGVWDINAGFNNGVLVTGGISGAGKALNKWGGGLLTLGGSNTFDGGLFVNTGILTLDFNQGTAPTNNIVAASNVLTLGIGSVVANGKSGNSVSQTFASTKLDFGASSLSITNGATNNTRTVVNLGAISRDAGTTVSFTQPTGAGTGNSTVAANNGFTTTTVNDASGILGGWATVGTEWAANNGTNIVAYTGYADLSGASPTITDGVNSNIRINGTSTGDVGQGVGTTTVNTIRSADSLARTITVGSGNTLRLGSAGGILATGGALTIGASGNAGSITAGGADNTAGELFLNNAASVIVNSVVADNGTGQVALVKAGSGTATLNAASTNTGGTYVNAGALVLTAGTDRLATTGNVSVYGGTLNLGTSTQNLSGELIIGGGSLNSSSAVTGGGSITNGTINKTGNSIDARGGTIGATITGTSGINKTTAGVLALANTTANTFSGSTVISEGTVIGGAGANVISISGDLVVGSVDGGNAASYRNSGNTVAFSSSRNLTVYSNGSVNFGGGAQNLGLSGASINVIGGTVGGTQVYLNNTVNMTGGLWAATTYGTSNNFATSASADTAVISGGLNAASNKTFTVADGAAAIDLQLTGNVAGTGVGIVKAGAGLMQINGNKTFTGTTTVSAGVLAVDSLANGGANSSIGASASTAGTLQLRDGSTFRYIGAATSTDRLFTVGQNGAGHSATLEASGSGAVSFTNTGNIAWGSNNQTRTFILGGTNTGDNSLAAVIANNGTGAVSVTKNGAGKWILGGVNTYTGNTTINAGTLLVNGSIANSTVEINGGVLGGNGTSGAVNVNLGGVLAPGASIGTLNTGAVSFASGATFALEINTDLGTTDLLNVTGNLSITGGAILTLSDLGSNTVLNTTLTVIDYSGTWNGGFFTYNGNVLADGATFNYGANSYTIDYDNGSSVTLAVAAIPEPATTALMGLALGGLFFARRKRA
jgi:fibronectin-binding autotransporter adhesin